MTRYLPLAFLVLLLSLYAPAALAQQPCSDIPGCDDTTGVPDDLLEAYPEPDVRPLVVDDAELSSRTYRRVQAGMQVYDAPGGSVLTTTGGYSYVTVETMQGDWMQIGDKQWTLRTFLSDDVVVSRYTGVRLPEGGLPYPMAWTLRHLRPAAVPGGDESPNNPFLYRYSRVTLYTHVEVDGRRWYQVGEGQWIHQYDVAKITPITRPAEVDTDKWVSVDLYEQVLIAYEGETPVFSTLVSSGLKDWGTNEGLFHIYLRYPSTDMSGAYQRPDFYYLQDVPWTMYFDGDIALHGTYWHDGFGYRQSHGCVNMSITDAKWLYDWSADEFDFSIPNDTGAAVYVYSSGDYDE